MAVGTIQLYNQTLKMLLSDTVRTFDDATAGNIMACLVDNTYTFSASHTTTTNIGAALITGGANVPVNVTNLTIDNTTTPGSPRLQSDIVEFPSGTRSPKWLVFVMPVVAGTFSATTSHLLFAVDLNTSSGSANIVVTDEILAVSMPADIDAWIKLAPV